MKKSSMALLNYLTLPEINHIYVQLYSQLSDFKCNFSTLLTYFVFKVAKAEEAHKKKNHVMSPILRKHKVLHNMMPFWFIQKTEQKGDYAYLLHRFYGSQVSLPCHKYFLSNLELHLQATYIHVPSFIEFVHSSLRGNGYWEKMVYCIFTTGELVLDPCNPIYNAKFCLYAS